MEVLESLDCEGTENERVHGLREWMMWRRVLYWEGRCVEKVVGVARYGGVAGKKGVLCCRICDFVIQGLGVEGLFTQDLRKE